MRQRGMNPDLEAELNSYAARRGAQSADWNAGLRRWPIYAAATAAALAKATSADASSILTGFSGQTLRVNSFFSRSGAETAVNLGGLGHIDMALFLSHSVSGGVVFNETGLARIRGTGGTLVNAKSGELSRFSSGKAITNGMARGTEGLLHEQIFRDFFGAGGTVFSTGFGQWAATQTGFAGFKLANGDLGWIQLELRGNGQFPLSFEALNWAVNTTPGASIAAGETTSVTPEPGTFGLALLAMGAAGVAALRGLRRTRAEAGERSASDTFSASS